MLLKQFVLITISVIFSLGMLLSCADDPPGPELLDQVHVYPNPFDSYFNIDTGSRLKNDLSYEIYNVNGAILIAGEIPSNALPLFEVQTEDFKNGMYFLKVMNKHDTITRRMIRDEFR